MKGYRFYAEYSSTYAKRHKPADNVVAVLLPELRNPGGHVEAITAVFSHANSAVAGSAVSHEYLRKKCKRVSERKAREIHPALFAWLDSFQDEAVSA